MKGRHSEEYLNSMAILAQLDAQLDRLMADLLAPRPRETPEEIRAGVVRAMRAIEQRNRRLDRKLAGIPPRDGDEQ